MNQFVGDYREAVPFDWDSMCSNGPTVEMCNTAREMQQECIELARRAAYFNERSLNRTHAQAVAASNKAAVAVAKLMGFSYPSSHTLSF
jgi:hypothetical protein